MKKKMSKETIHARIQLIKSLKTAIKESDKLNLIWSHISSTLHENAAKKAA